MEAYEQARGADAESRDFWRIVERLRDVATIKQVFGEPIPAGEVVVIPVAAVKGGGGGGGGTQPDGSGRGGGGGLGFQARPVGVYVVRGDEVTWRPAVDALRVVLGFQAVALIGALAVGRALRRSRRRHR
ncbi:MAG: hypothetical protein KJ056_06595 [Acidimicrobiia bacterium]|nr:hypothetical protein [Acidimicrobiia bacterium]MCL4292684.1 hypothetical protein [Acidimicrobiia bacterium]